MYTHVQYVSSRVILVRPPEAVQDLKYFIVLNDTEQPVEEDLEANGSGVGSVQHEAGNIEDDVRLDNLNRLSAHLMRRRTISHLVQR